MLKTFFARALEKFSLGPDPQEVTGVGVKKVEWFQENSYLTMAFYVAQTGKLLKRDNSSTYYTYLEDGRIFEKPARQEKWREVYPDIHGQLFFNSELDKTVEDAKQNGMEVEVHPYDVYRRVMQQRQWIIYNGTEEQFEKVAETHPVPQRSTITFDKTGCDPDILNPKSKEKAHKPPSQDYRPTDF